MELRLPISNVGVRLPISNVGVRISAVFPRKQRVSALVVFGLRRSSSHLFAGLGLSRTLSSFLGTRSGHSSLPWRNFGRRHTSHSLRLEHSSAGTLFGSFQSLRHHFSSRRRLGAATRLLINSLCSTSRVVSLSRIGMGRRLSACESHSTSVSELVKVAETPGRGFCVSSLSIFPRGCAQQKQSRFDQIRGDLSGLTWNA